MEENSVAAPEWVWVILPGADGGHPVQAMLVVEDVGGMPMYKVIEDSAT